MRPRPDLRLPGSLVAAALVAATLVVAASPARAEEPPARAAFREGERAFELGKFEEAIAAYERAFGLDPQPAFIFNIALAHRRQYELDGKLEHLLRARELYRNYLRLDPQSPRRAGVEKILAELSARIDGARGQPVTPPPPDLRAAPPASRAPDGPPPFAPARSDGPATVRKSPPPSSSHAAWYIVGGAALLAAAAVTVLLIAAHDRPPTYDGPPVDLRPR